MARRAPPRGVSLCGATVPPIVRSPRTLVIDAGRLMNFAHVSRAVTKNKLRVRSNDGDMKFVPPYQSGHVIVPSSVGSWPGITFGLPSCVSSFAHDVLTNGLPRM